jgi:hypothetical protein
MRSDNLIALALLSVLALGQTDPNGKASNLGPDGQRFQGAWRVFSVTDTRPDGTEAPDLYLGAHPVGLLIYEGSGYMCFGAMNLDRPRGLTDLAALRRRWRPRLKATTPIAELTK